VHFLTRVTLRAPALAAALLLTTTALAAIGALRLQTDTGFRAYLGEQHPVVQELDRFIDGFGGGFPVAAIWKCADGAPCASVFDADSLAMADTLSRTLRAQSGVRRVSSPAVTGLFVPSEDGFTERRFVENGRVVADAATLGLRAAADPLWQGSLVSADGRVGAVVAELASTESATTVAVMRALRDALAPFEARGYQFHLVGQPVEILVTDEEIAADAARLVPLTTLLVGLVIFLLLRSWQAVLAALATMGIALVWTLGLVGWLGWPQNALSQTLSPLILVVGVADAVHFLTRYAALSAQQPATSRAARRIHLLGAAGEVGPACLTTATTTAVGFLSFATSGAESFVRFGVTAAFGIAAAVVLSFTFLPLLMSVLPGSATPARVSAAWDRALGRLAKFTVAQRWPILVAAAVLGAIGAIGFARLRVEVDAYELYGPESRVVRWARFAEENLRRPDSLEIVLETAGSDTLEAPGRLERVDAVARFASGVPGLGRARSVIDPVARANRLLHGDDAARERLATGEGANAELLLLLSLQDGAALDSWLSVDHRRARISVEAEKMNQAERAAALTAVREHLDTKLGDGWRYGLTGPVAVYYRMVQEIHGTQLSSFASAGVAVFLLISLYLRSLRWGFLAMLPNLLPIVVTLGVMGLLGIHLDMGTAMVAAVVLGISDDDTVHVLTTFGKHRRAGLDPSAAIQRAMREVGAAVITASFALSIGFAAMSFSQWQSVASFGLLSGIAILVALLADLIVLPALVVAVGPRLLPGEGWASTDAR
jgi:predicted RND superfamily exporter protein